MKAYPRVYFGSVVGGRGRQMMSTWFSQAKVMTSSFLVCELCRCGTYITGSLFVDFMYLMKWRNHWVKFSLCFHPDGRRAWADPVGVSFISSGFSYSLGNKSNGGMKYPDGLIQVTTVTRDTRSADWTKDIWRLPSNQFFRVSVLYNSDVCAVH